MRNVLRLMVVGVAIAAASGAGAAHRGRHFHAAHPRHVRPVAPGVSAPWAIGGIGAAPEAGLPPVNDKSLNSLTGTEHCIVGESFVPRC